MRIRFLVLLLVAAGGCSRQQPPPPPRNPILPQAGGTGTLTLTTNGTGAASLSGDPNSGYALNVPYFAGFLTTMNSTGPASVNNGVLNVPNYTGGGVTMPPGSFPGQSLIVGTGNMLAATNPGLAEAASSPALTAMPSCGTTSSLGDLSQTFVLPAGATVMVPSGTCTNAVFYFFAQGPATFNTSGGQMLNIYNGAAYNTGTTYAASAGQYITLVRSKAANTWIAAIGNAGGGMVPAGSTGITSVTTTGTGTPNPATYNSTTGVLNIPDYSTSAFTLPTNSYPGQVLAIGPQGTMIAGSPGLSDSAASPVSAAYAPSCGTTSTGDRSSVTVVTAAVPVTIPPSTSIYCNHAVFYFLMRAAATLQRSGADTFDIYTGATALVGQASYTAAAGQYLTVSNGSGSNWHVTVGYATSGPVNLQQHFFSPDFTMTAVTTVASTGQGTNPITLVATPQALCSFYLVIDTPMGNTKIEASIYRTTGTIPALGAAPGGTDARVAIVTFPYAGTGALTTVSGTIYDTVGGPVTATPYTYYLAMDSAASQNINIHAQSYLQVAEVH